VVNVGLLLWIADSVHQGGGWTSQEGWIPPLWWAPLETTPSFSKLQLDLLQEPKLGFPTQLTILEDKKLESLSKK
jgi:hypothetical protein